MNIKITDDFDLHKIADSGQCFRTKEFPDGTFRFIHGDQILYIRQIHELEYEIDSQGDFWDSFWKPYFDFGRNYSQVRKRILPEDSYLTKAAAYGKGIRILRQDPWETLVTFIISQRKSIPAIKSAVNILCEKYGRPIDTSRETIYSFPSADVLSSATERELLSCGLGYRTPYIAAAIRQAANGSLDLVRLQELSDEELMENLKSLQGVGCKVASCVCLFAYGRTQMAPVDTWISRVITEQYGGRNPFPDYGSDAGIMQQYMFYYARDSRKTAPQR